MVDPSAFDVRYAINPHMLDSEGRLRPVARARARRQWEALRETFERIGLEVTVLEADPELPDMVFAANHGLPRGKKVVMARMAHAEREPETARFAAWYRAEGFDVRGPEIFGRARFEGTGDALWVPGRPLLLGGHGFRTDRACYGAIGEVFDCEVELLELRDPRFYHLDTCLSVLSAEAAAYVPDAFTDSGRERLERVFPRLIGLPADEALASLPANAFCPDGERVVIQSGASRSCGLLREAGFFPVETDTSEFIKAGGSVFCLKMALS